jgi:HSP20 family protein
VKNMPDKRPIKALGESGWDLSGHSMEPLLNIEDTGTHLLVSLDLPSVKKEDIEVTVTDEMLHVTAKTCRTYCFSRWGTAQRTVEFSSFSKTISLPEKVDAKAAESKFRQGILEILLPKKQTKKKLKVE